MCTKYSTLCLNFALECICCGQELDFSATIYINGVIKLKMLCLNNKKKKTNIVDLVYYGKYFYV